MNVYRCNICNFTVREAAGRRSHLHWHKITDSDVEKYFTMQEEVKQVPPHGAQAEVARKKGILGWLRKG